VCEKLQNSLIHIISYEALNISVQKLMERTKYAIAVECWAQYLNVCIEGLNCDGDAYTDTQ
jgi:hypothetical protein